MAAPDTCSFVNFTTPTSKEEHLSNRYLIRSRTIKNNRRKQLQRTTREQDDYFNKKAISASRTLLPTRSRRADSQLASLDVAADEIAQSDDFAQPRRDGADRKECRGLQSEGSATVARLTLAPPISPFFGALATTTFDSASHTNVAETSVLGKSIRRPTKRKLTSSTHAVFQVLFRPVFTPTEISAYYAAFCQKPLIFYSYAHLHLFVNSNLHQTAFISPREEARKYSFSIKISTILQNSLRELRDEDVEPVLLAMTLMAKHRSDADVQALSTQSTLFTPYAQYSDLLEAFQAGHIESFIPAVRTLVNRIGGLHRLKTPGLSKMIRMNGLTQAATTCNHPYFDNCFNTHRLLAAQGPVWDFLSSSADGLEGDVPGIGFHTQVPGGLPPCAVAACMNLSTTDRLLSLPRPREVSLKDFQLLTSARASVQHQLLALPEWLDLSPTERGLGSPLLYDCVRNAALLYCNAVVRPVLPGSKGVQEPIRRLREALEAVGDVAALPSEYNAVLLWCAVIGSLGSYSTWHWWFFIALLRELVERLGIFFMEGLVEVIRGFVWSDAACWQGLEVVWGAMYS